jgi:nitrogen fixation NifU-like protein
MSYRDIFGEILADHHESPRNFGEMTGATAIEEGYNPLCGDKVKMYVKLAPGEGAALAGNGGQTIAECKYQGEGCSICMASASILSERIQGKSVDEVSALIEAFREKMQGREDVQGLPADDADDDLVALYGIKRFPVRIKCALLAWTTLKRAMSQSNVPPHGGKGEAA